MKVLGTPDGKCEWEVWGWLEQEVYVWALCQAGPEPGSSAASVPAVLVLGKERSIQAVELPGDGTNYSPSIRRLFPPTVQAKVFEHNFDVKAAEERLAARWKDASLPPTIYAQTGDPLPRQGGETVPAISSEFVDRMVPVTSLGKGNIDRLAFLRDGRLAAYGKRGIEIMDVVQGQAIQPYQDLLEGKAGVLSPDGNLLAFWDADQVRVLRVVDGTILLSNATGLPGGTVVGVEFLPDGKTLAVEVRPPGEEIYSHQIELYGLYSGALLKKWDMQGRAMLFSPNGRVMASRYAMTGLKLWSIPDGRLIRTLQAVVGGAAFSPDGRLLAAADMGVVRVFQVADGKALYQLPAEIGPTSGVAFSPDGNRLLTWSRDSYQARLWNSRDGSPEINIPIQGVTAGAFTLDSAAVTLAGNGAVGLYSSSTGELIGSLGDYFPEVVDISFAPEVSPGENARLAVLYGINTQHTLLASWNIPQGTRRFLSDAYPAMRLVYTRDPFGIAVGTWDGTVQMIDPENGALLRTFEGLSAQVMALAENEWADLAAGSMNEVRIFALPDANDLTGRKIPVFGGWVDGLSWPCYLVAASSDGIVHLLDGTGERIVQTLKTADDGYESHLSISQDCRRILVGKHQAIFRWQTTNWEALPTWSFSDTITALDISPDGSLVAVGFTSGEVQLLSSQSGKLLRDLETHPGGVNALEFSPNGSYLAVGGGDGVVIVWGMN